MSYEGITLNALSVSLGVASFPSHGSQGADVVRAADGALYQAKARGRSQVVVAAVPALKVADSSVPSNHQEIS